MDESQMALNFKYSTIRFDLTPLIELALQTKDKEWFNDLTCRMNYYGRVAE